MIWITGDTHGDFSRFGSKRFPQAKSMTREDTVIICGDHGGVWDGSPREAYWLNWLEDRPFTTFFVDGNHENFNELNALPVHTWHGGKVHYVRPHVIHLMRGQVFEIGGLTFFTIGGASSHDIQDGVLDPASPGFEREYWFKRRTQQMFRVKGVSWWPEELPSEEDYEEAVRNLEKASWQVDCVLTHCLPTSVMMKISGDYTPDRLTDFLDTVMRRCRFDSWYAGHYHRNCVVDERFIVQWEQVTELKQHPPRQRAAEVDDMQENGQISMRF